ncbi:MAG: hypothetical protein ABI655_06555 [Phenylobacterium sp.]
MTAEDYRSKAREMLSYAARTSDPGLRSEWAEMARVWRQLEVQRAVQEALARAPLALEMELQ